MAACGGRVGGFMFCDICGTMLLLASPDFAQCPYCKFKKSASLLSDKQICYKVTAEINKKCEKCSNTKLKFSTRQMRSADEGQTTFYHCPKCLHTFTEN